jgi:Family of unknown function (DUF6152)
MFDITNNVTYKGVVVEYLWQNPYSHIIVKVGADAKDPSSVGTWDIDASSINLMVSQGWNRLTYQTGTQSR